MTSPADTAMSGRPVLARLALLPFQVLESVAAPAWIEAIDRWLGHDQELRELRSTLSDRLFECAKSSEHETDAERQARFALLGLRRAIHNHRAVSAGDLRRAQPRLSADLQHSISEVTARAQQQQQGYTELQRMTEQAQRTAHQRLLELWSEPARLEALRLSSRALTRELHELHQHPAAAWGHDQRYVAAKSVSYLWRYATKTSPFGLFCSTALAMVADTTSQARPVSVDRCRMLLSVAETRKISACLACDEALAGVIRPRLNPTARRVEGSWLFWRVATHRRDEDEEVLSRVKSTAAVEIVVELVGSATHTLNQLRHDFSERLDLPLADATAYLGKLVDVGLLVAEIELPYNCERPLRALADAAATATAPPEWVETVRQVELRVDAWPGQVPQERRESEREIERALESLAHTRKLVADELLRVDAASESGLTVARSWLHEIRRSVSCYARLFGAIYPRSLYAATYQRRFLQHFPADREIPALDFYHGVFEETGPQSGSPILVAPHGEDERAVRAGERFERVRAAVIDAARRLPFEREMAIDEPWLTETVGSHEEPTWSAAVTFQVDAQPQRADRIEPTRLVISGLFHGTGLAFSRFAALHSGGVAVEESLLACELRRAWSMLERPGSVMAELTYNHTARSANAGLRPALLDYEIELPGETGSPGKCVIPLRELTARFDSATERFHLRWPQRNLDVLPIISSGVNPTGVISFLVHIGQQALQPLGLFVGFDDASIVHWPRLVVGRVVLFRERWVFRATDRPRLEASDLDFAIEVTRWRRQHSLPRFAFASSSTEAKPQGLDLESPLSLDVLRRLISPIPEGTAHTLTLTEMLPSPTGLWTEGESGNVACEFQVQMQHLAEEST